MLARIRRIAGPALRVLRSVRVYAITVRARLRLRRIGTDSRLAAASRTLALDTWKNVARKAFSQRLEEGRPLRTAQEIADLSRQLLEERFGLDVRDVQIQVEWDGKKELSLTAVPKFEVVREAFGA